MGSSAMSIGSLAGGAIGTIAMNIVQGYFQEQQSKAQEKVYKQQEAYAKQQAEEVSSEYERIAKIKDTNAKIIEEQGIESARRRRMEDIKRIEEQRAMMADSGLSLNIGEPLKIQEENDITSRLNALDIFKNSMAMAEQKRYEANVDRYRGEQRKRSLLWEAENYRYQADLEKSNQKMIKVMTVASNITTGFTASSQAMGAMSANKGSFNNTMNTYSNNNFQDTSGAYYSSNPNSTINNYMKNTNSGTFGSGYAGSFKTMLA